MKAITHRTYGSPDVLQLEDVAKPTPNEDEVLVKIHAASVAAGDWHIVRAKPFLVRFEYGLLKPKNLIPGADIAGVVEAVGEHVNEFQAGDAVFGSIYEYGSGAFAEYVAVPAEALVQKPTNMTFEQAAALPTSSVTALQGLRDRGGIQAGQKVIVNGASGGVGTFAVQIAKALGAEVTGVSSTSKAEMVRSLGVDHVIDYKQEDFTQNGETYDLIFDAAAYRSIRDYRDSLTERGTYVMVGGSGGQLIEAMTVGSWLSKKGGKTFTSLLSTPTRTDLQFIKQLVEDGKVTPVIDRCLPLREVPDAVRYVEEGRARGKVVINVVEDDTH